MLIGLLVALVFAGIGVFLIMNNMKLANQAKAAAAWPTAAGKMLDHRVDHHVSRTNKGGTRHSYTPEVTYTYDHGGQTYTGSRLHFSNVNYSSQKAATDALNVYPIGSDLKVYVNPQDPSDSALSATTKVSWFLPLMMIGAAVLCLVIFAVNG